MTTSTLPPKPASPPSSRGSATPNAPSPARYWIGGALIAIGFLGALAWVGLGWLALMHHIDGFPRMTIPGSATVQVSADSKRVLYAEHLRGGPDVTATDIQVTDPSGHAVPVGAYAYDLRYDVPGDAARVGRAVATFRSTTAGSYTVTVSAGPSGTIAIGDDAVRDALPHVIGAGVLFLVGVGSGTALIGMTSMRRARARRA